jgi:hypothetical protein
MSRQHHNPGQPPPPTCPALKSVALCPDDTDVPSVLLLVHWWPRPAKLRVTKFIVASVAIRRSGRTLAELARSALSGDLRHKPQ